MSAVPPLMPGSLNLATLEVDKAKIRAIIGDSLSTLNTWKGSVRLASVANHSTLVGTITVDGVVTAVGDRVLLKAQSDAITNGVYVVSALAWKRASDVQVGSHASGLAIFVSEGTTLSDTIWVCTTDAPTDVVGTDVLSFSTVATISSGVGPLNAVQTSDGIGGVNASTVLATTGGLLTVPAGINVTTVGVTVDSGDITATLGNVVVTTGGVTTETGLSIGADTNQSMGTATLVAGTVTVSNTYVASGDYIFLTLNTPGGTLGTHYSAPVGSIVATTSFVINSVNTAGAVSTADTSTIRYLIVRPVV